MKLSSHAAKAETAPRKKSGSAIDKAYVDHEVAYHQAVIGAVDKVLLPGGSRGSWAVIRRHTRRCAACEASGATSGHARWSSSPSLLLSPGNPAQPSPAPTAKIAGMKFVPRELTVQAGETVVWKNEDLVPHTVSGPGFSSPVLQPGWTATKKGARPYRCTLHPMMKAQLTVR